MLADRTRIGRSFEDMLRYRLFSHAVVVQNTLITSNKAPLPTHPAFLSICGGCAFCVFVVSLEAALALTVKNSATAK